MVGRAIDRTDRGVTRPSLLPPSARSQKSRASALDFSLRAEGVNNEGQVALRSVLLLLYLKHDQKSDRI